ncbi:albusnodin/ikarugamycin family macrolactam cyclase [Planomonospora parontospora]|uniref:albusnodin/ikarugamycin family macrolactam cyclase n=1 Tax=Planomonospora parontospora TaxID=58119 RepID=UPI001670A39E|nr:albusnodin/ikarugamycin family macrolactam cyclase [Planomonospora parontospora]GGL53571.1 asparagine synthase [Planomonospora parontospora subsp. antibiotica]GII19601.1 asparagine synthase [Planomonospora parontospora subsp. antibiotica]
MLAGSTTPFPAPTLCARRLWATPHPVWHTGERDCRSVHAGPVRLAVAGDCYASDEQLRRGLRAVAGRRWSELTCWPGSYWVAATDGTVTVVLGDLVGARPVYHAQTGRTIVWATRAAPLADLTGAGVEVEQLAAWLAAATVPEVLGESTVYRGVALVLPGSLLQLPGPAVHPYEPPRTAGMDEAAGGLRHALVEAAGARVRVHPHLSADVSGGLDSTTIAAAAAHAGARMPVFTHLLAEAPNDDLEYAEHAAAELPGLDHHVVATADAWFQGLDQAPVTDLPYGDAARWAVHAAYLREIAEHGTAAHLTGGGGDTLFSPPAYALADLARTRRWRQVVRHAAARARLRHLPVTRAVRAALTASAVTHPEALCHLARALARPDRSPRTPWIPAAGITAWFTPDAAAELAHRTRQAAHSAPLLPGHAQAAHRAWCETREYGAYHAQYADAAAAIGVRLHAPLLDNQVVRAALSIPVHERVSAAWQKPLLARAAVGLVPERVLRRPTKGSLGGAAYTGVAAHREAITALLDSSRLAAAGIVDRARVENGLARLAAGAPGPLAALELLVSAELWLSRQETRPAMCTGEEAACPC